jgi:phosphoglycerate dehydrogenase-like enzyme
MTPPAPTIWCNIALAPEARALLERSIRPCPLVFAAGTQASNLVAGAPDAAFFAAEIVFGQPDPQAVPAAGKLRWIHLSSAGYERYMTAEFRAEVARRGIVVTNSSAVYAAPCAEHMLAVMLALARQLPAAIQEQCGGRGWPSLPLRARSRLLLGQTALLLGLGSIGRRLAGLLQALGMRVLAVRRNVRGDEPVATHAVAKLHELLPQADHIVNLLPGGPETAQFCDQAFFAAVRPGALFYNLGRGGTVDQEALAAALSDGRLAGAWLDVTSPEPLPPDHILWKLPNCWITPHTSGGHADEPERLVRHFLANLQRFRGDMPLADRVL